MLLKILKVQQHLLLLTLGGALLPLPAGASSCKSQSQMTSGQRDTLSSAARTIIGEVQSGNVSALRAYSIPELAADFSNVADSIESLKPLMQNSSIAVDSLYAMDASIDSSGAGQTDFFCGTPLVVLTFTKLPPGRYAFVIVHATGVPLPQQISMILAETDQHGWLLGGFFSKPMVEAGHDGLWYWVTARDYAQRGLRWDAWLYYRTAVSLLQPVEFLSSPNLVKLQQEQKSVHPEESSGAKPLLLNANGFSFQVTSITTTDIFGALDLEVHYIPDTAQVVQLRTPTDARKQVTEVMTALLTLHPEIQQAFHGFWVHADGESANIFSLELPLDQILPAKQQPFLNQSSVLQ